MKNKIVLTIIAAVLGLSGCNSTSSSNSDANETANDGRICKREKSIGSNIPKKVCGTPEEMALMEERSKRLIDRMQRKPTLGTSNG